MTQRERLLAIAVGGLMLALLFSWGLGRYRSALDSRRLALSGQQNQQEQINQKLIGGEYANRYMGEYLIRSLPANAEQAKSTYKKWLLETVVSNQIDKPTVSANNSRLVGGLYQRFEFQVSGQAEVSNFVELLYDFYAKDYLHRIRRFSLTPMKEGRFKLEMSIDAIGLVTTPQDLPARESPSWRVQEDFALHRDPILNRNLFEPPNQPPQYNGQPVVETVRGSSSPTPLTFEDPEGQSIDYEFIEPPPTFVKLDQQSGMLTVSSDEKQEFTIRVRATDAGFPSRSIEQMLTVKVVEPAPKPKQPEPAPTFDDASQTLLTGLVQGGGEWTAWMNVRTRGKTLKLRAGDQFEIGTVKGTVSEVSARQAILEINGKRVTLRQGATLAEAITATQEG